MFTHLSSGQLNYYEIRSIFDRFCRICQALAALNQKPIYFYQMTQTEIMNFPCEFRKRFRLWIFHNLSLSGVYGGVVTFVKILLCVYQIKFLSYGSKHQNNCMPKQLRQLCRFIVVNTNTKLFQIYINIYKFVILCFVFGNQALSLFCLQILNTQFTLQKVTEKTGRIYVLKYIHSAPLQMSKTHNKWTSEEIQTVFQYLPIF
ncbi:Hypothetical_protein [Hexamita inflata]|uniref:Hypothetical_protein n=1 Tax=Hexamita inflata TaxID=28002 RepID=A0AA86R4S8_9EUKA|nr:Hypothetical protein HINF_LOCUS56503 [Hexamita inflata]